MIRINWPANATMRPGLPSNAVARLKATSKNRFFSLIYLETVRDQRKFHHFKQKKKMKGLEEIVSHLHASIADEVLSKSEKRILKELVTRVKPDDHQLNVLRAKIYELAHARINEKNQAFIIDWLKQANSALLPAPPDSSDVFFSPGEACRDVIISQIDSAIRQLNICAFTISDDQITERLLAAHRKGVHINIITDNDKSLDEGSDVEELAKAGIAVRMDTTPNHMHHKFMVTDQRSLITGSYNWTRSAARYNHENILLTREPAAVKSFEQQFKKLWEVMTEYS